MRAILYGIPFSALLSQVRTTENHLFAQKVLFFCSKKMYNVVGMCSFLLFVGDFRDLSAKFAIAIYPREGTKTRRNQSPCNGRTDCNLSPQGDGNCRTRADNLHQLVLQFIPARGRKLSGIVVNVHRLALQFIPARGQKSTSATGVCQQRRCFAFSYILFYRLGAAPAGIVFVTGSALTPCGTSGFMGRISCR